MARTPVPDAPAPRRRFGRRKAAAAGAASGAPKAPGALAQFRESVSLTRKHDRAAVWLGLLVTVVVIAAFVGLGFVLGHELLLPIVGVPLGLLAGVNLFGWRAQKAVYAEVADRRGVALEVVRRMRGDWKITEAVQFTRNQDFVHRVVGRPGIVLIAEGRPQAARDLLRTESRRVRRVAPDVPVYEVVVGSGADDVPLAKLRPHIIKLKRALKPAQIRSLDVKLKAVANTSLPLPKGPMSTRMPRGKIR